MLQSGEKETIQNRILILIWKKELSRLAFPQLYINNSSNRNNNNTTRMQLPFSKQSYIARLMQMYFRCELISSFFLIFIF